MRHILGSLIGIALAPALIFGSSWAFTKLYPTQSMSLTLAGGVPYSEYLQHSYLGLLMMVILGLVLGLLVVTSWVPPSVTLVPALVLLGWTVLYVAAPDYAFDLSYPHPVDMEGSVTSGRVGRGQEMLLSRGIYALIGSILLVPALLPARWKGHSGTGPARWRRWHGLLLGALVTPLLAAGSGWARSQLIWSQRPDGFGARLSLGHHLLALVVMAAVGLMVGWLITTRRIPPLTTLVPGLVFLGWTAWFIGDAEAALRIAPNYPRTEYERILELPEGLGYVSLLQDHVYLMVGITLVVAALLPARWRTAGDAHHLTELVANLTRGHRLRVGSRTPRT